MGVILGFLLLVLIGATSAVVVVGAYWLITQMLEDLKDRRR